jgi:hypothetical protein
VVDILYRDVIKGVDTHVEKLLTPALCELQIDIYAPFYVVSSSSLLILNPPPSFGA